MTERITADEYHTLTEPTTKKKNQHPEYNIQVACWNHWQAIRLPGWFATARDLATKSASEGDRKKAMGCISGIFDLEFWLPAEYPRRRLHAECKAANSFGDAMKKLTQPQRDMIPIIEAHGEAWDVFWSVQSFVDMLTRHGIPWVQPRHMMTAQQIDISLNERRAPKKKKAGTGKKRKEAVSAAHKRFQRNMYK